MKRFISLAAIAFATVVTTQSALAQAYFSGTLDATSPTWTRPLASGTGLSTAGCAYAVQAFYVTVSGTYVFETSSFTLPGAAANMDTFEYIYQNAFDPNNQLVNFVAGNDDFTGTLTVLPGPYAGVGLTTAATGSAGVQPSSRISTASLTAGVQYYAVESSFYAAANTNGRGVGPYWAGIGGGQGNAILGTVPEPASMAVLAIGGLALLRRRKRA